MHRTLLLILTGLAFAPGAAHAARSYDNCTGFVDSLPATITTQGTWCLRKDLATAITSGAAINVATNNVTLDCNDFKLGNLAAGDGTSAKGVTASQKTNVTVRNCAVRGFRTAIFLDSWPSGGSYFVENNNIQGATSAGIFVGGDGSIVRNNLVNDIGGTGISTAGTLDIVGNSVTDVLGTDWVAGIATSANYGGSVAGNRIRGVALQSSGQAIGIYNDLSGRMSIRDNDIFSAGAFQGVFCFTGQGRARGNIISGFANGIVGCGDAGGNDVTP